MKNKEARELIAYANGQGIFYQASPGKFYARIGSTTIRLTEEDLQAIREERIDTPNLQRINTLLRNRVKNLRAKFEVEKRKKEGNNGRKRNKGKGSR